MPRPAALVCAQPQQTASTSSQGFPFPRLLALPFHHTIFFSLNYQAQVSALLGLCLKALRASRVQQKDPTSKPCFKAFPRRMGESRQSTTSLGPGTTIPPHAEAEVDQHRPLDQPRMQPCSHCTTNSFHFGQFCRGNLLVLGCWGFFGCLFYRSNTWWIPLSALRGWWLFSFLLFTEISK